MMDKIRGFTITKKLQDNVNKLIIHHLKVLSLKFLPKLSQKIDSWDQC
jgi:hypothetical protein